MNGTCGKDPTSAHLLDKVPQQDIGQVAQLPSSKAKDLIAIFFCFLLVVQSTLHTHKRSTTCELSW